MDNNTSKINLQIEKLKNIKYPEIFLTKKESIYIDQLITENDTNQQETKRVAWEGWDLDSCGDQYHSNDI
jgi:hypothetical protein